MPSARLDPEDVVALAFTHTWGEQAPAEPLSHEPWGVVWLREAELQQGCLAQSLEMAGMWLADEHGAGLVRNQVGLVRAIPPKQSPGAPDRSVATPRASWRVAKLSSARTLPSPNQKANVRGPPIGSSAVPTGPGPKSGPSTVTTTRSPAPSASIRVTLGNRPPPAEPSTSATSSRPWQASSGKRPCHTTSAAI